MTALDKDSENLNLQDREARALLFDEPETQHPTPSQQLFSFRFGGAVSLRDELLSYESEVPRFLRPIWPFIVNVICHYLREWQIKNMLRSVDKQVSDIGDLIVARDENLILDEAVTAAKQQNPDAIVYAIKVPVAPEKPGDTPPRPLPAIVIEESPSSTDSKLGGSMTITSPWKFLD